MGSSVVVGDESERRGSVVLPSVTLSVLGVTMGSAGAVVEKKGTGKVE